MILVINQYLYLNIWFENDNVQKKKFKSPNGILHRQASINQKTWSFIVSKYCEMCRHPHTHTHTERIPVFEYHKKLAVD